ncbi:hypothetical protein NDU88_001638 [Pleurodeles waltl]|uniref:t-SNARE coiled-coil homology domain-containing protein n=1 Tax=Pleurodeles waltl TaxID=8319 RepID=A0AAV7VC21_PLEWA|nr:hypothetical protein NDU88_001638 [Pleurodeles waltl]
MHRRQTNKLLFEESKPTDSAETATAMGAAAAGAQGTLQPSGADAILMELREELQSIDAIFDTLDGCLDHMGEYLERQSADLDSAEESISGLADGVVTMSRRLKNWNHASKQ